MIPSRSSASPTHHSWFRPGRFHRQRILRDRTAACRTFFGQISRKHLQRPIIHRRDRVRQSFIEDFLFNNLLLVAATFAVMWGTLLPLIPEGFFGEQITVGPPFFNRINIPFGG